MHVRYKLPDTDWAWYATAFDGVDTFYGLVVEDTFACTTFSLKDLAQLCGPHGALVEYDHDFEPTPLGTAKTLHELLRSERRLLTAVPTNWVAKEDLLSIRPDLADQIAALDTNDLSEIADKVGNALSETYWMALEIVLSDYLNKPSRQILG